ncbi:hypothetical protein [uncultured Lentibacter sp.]|uniref:hypothetical protein n=1 Tax=uncultured Lentibacter sp. TaxID=1659309 RepID=UPI00260DA16A|nr:hypothetical protein [uncultured Lentibacter sp.]MCW1954897.1 hypothetical protein [Roseobacter sp.]
MSYGVAYFTVFLGGPLLVLLLTRRAATQRSFVLGVSSVAVLTALAVFWGRVPGLETVAMLWLAWVGTVALCVRVVMRRVETKRGLALTKAIGAMASVIPWIGLAAADWMTG